MTDISNNDDLIDSRDIVEAIAELEAQKERHTEDESKEVWTNADQDELDLFKAIVEEIDNNGGDKAEDGVTLIRDSHFKDYAIELANDCGMIEKDVKWPYTCIDWEQAAWELQMDYASLEFNGVTYWFR